MFTICGILYVFSPICWNILYVCTFLLICIPIWCMQVSLIVSCFWFFLMSTLIFASVNIFENVMRCMEACCMCWRFWFYCFPQMIIVNVFVPCRFVFSSYQTWCLDRLCTQYISTLCGHKLIHPSISTCISIHIYIYIYIYIHTHTRHLPLFVAIRHNLQLLVHIRRFFAVACRCPPLFTLCAFMHCCFLLFTFFCSWQTPQDAILT